VKSLQPNLRVVEAAPAADGALVLAFLDGDAAAFGELVRRHQEVAYRLARRFSKSSDDAFDLTQKAFLQAFEAARRSVLKGGADFPFRSWLLRIVVNLGKNLVRDTRRWSPQPVEEIDKEKSVEGGAQAELELAEKRALMREAVDKLPPRQREVFALRIDAGLSFADVASTLDITENNAKTHFHHAVKRLRAEVGLLSGEEKP
jgi:RNA polymerase sigma-70 factor (ECF subfamily)